MSTRPPARATPTRTKRRQRRKAARPAELAEAALELFVERGFDATRLEDVAARAGVAKGTVYLYFASKEALFDGVVRQAILPAVERGEQHFDRARGPSDRLLRETLAAWVSAMTDTPLGRVPALIVSDSRKFPELARVFHDVVIVRAQRLVRSVLERGVQRGEFRVPDIETTAQILTCSMLMFAIGRDSIAISAGASPEPARFVDALVHLAVHGVAVPAGMKN